MLTLLDSIAATTKEMMLPLPPKNDSERLASLTDLRMLDSVCESSFDEIAELASQICETPMALISLVDQGRRRVKARVGFDASQTQQDVGFCVSIFNTPNEITEIPDARQDPRFSATPLITSDPSICFYAGAPMVTKEGKPLGTLCVIDRQARILTEVQRESLKMLARQAVAQVERQQNYIFQQEATADLIALNNIGSDQRNAMLMAGEDLKAFLGLDYVYRYVNRTYLEYWRKSTNDIVGRSVIELVGQSTFDTLVKPMLDRSARGETVSYDGEFDFPGKGKRYMRVTYSPARNLTTAMIGIVVRVHDIDHLKRTEQSLQASVQKLVDLTSNQQQFIYILSHDLREPLNTIINFSSALQSDFSAQMSSPARQFLGFIASGATRMKTLLDDLTQYVRLDRADIDWEECDLNQIVNDALLDLSDNIQRDRANVEVPLLPVIKGRASLLRLLFQNLIANAVKFHRPGVTPNINISVQSNASEWQIAVKDDGIGIDEKLMPTLFKAFRRLNSQKEFAGSGIGLAMVKKITEIHGGRVWIKSTKGVGSEFFATIAKTPSQRPSDNLAVQGMR